MSPSGSVTAMRNASITCPGLYALLPGFVIAGGLFVPPPPAGPIVIVNVAVTGSLVPSFALTVTLYPRSSASAATVPDTLRESDDHANPGGRPDTATVTSSPPVTMMRNASITAPRW